VALELEKVRREREIESLQQCQSEVISHAVESAETQRREYENQLRQLQSELAEHQLKAAMLEQNQQPLSAAAESVIFVHSSLIYLIFYYIIVLTAILG